ncbi:hypothetical protein SNEBB_010264 [Seison nebaliae]|nr:hypothetical protein SNEBB_010264 [Seison nebaliae]
MSLLDLFPCPYNCICHDSREPLQIYTKLFVGNIDMQCSQKHLLPLFERYGYVLECEIIRDYAFVHYQTAKEAAYAKSSLNGFNIFNRRIRIDFSLCKCQCHKKVNSYASVLINSKSNKNLSRENINLQKLYLLNNLKKSTTGLNPLTINTDANQYYSSSVSLPTTTTTTTTHSYFNRRNGEFPVYQDTQSKKSLVAQLNDNQRTTMKLNVMKSIEDFVDNCDNVESRSISTNPLQSNRNYSHNLHFSQRNVATAMNTIRYEPPNTSFSQFHPSNFSNLTSNNFPSIPQSTMNGSNNLFSPINLFMGMLPTTNNSMPNRNIPNTNNTKMNERIEKKQNEVNGSRPIKKSKITPENKNSDRYVMKIEDEREHNILDDLIIRNRTKCNQQSMNLNRMRLTETMDEDYDDEIVNNLERNIIRSVESVMDQWENNHISRNATPVKT